jgi:hypothetical protein
MAFTTRVFRVFIASPGDVQEERELIRNSLYDWNDIYSSSRRIMLQPIGWERNSIPEMGAHPQKILNTQLLDNADVLIAIFWTRLGTPTDTHQSGTVEEIEEHLEKGKPALIYFSDLPVRLDSVDEEQYRTLKEFKESLRNRGLLENYATIDQFAQKITRHIQTLFSNQDTFPGLSSVEYEKEKLILNSTNTAAFPPAGGIGLEAMDLLITAEKSDGKITFRKNIRNLIIQAGGKTYDTSTPRNKAKWVNAVEQLVSSGYIRSESSRGDIYEITENGYQLAELLDD